MTIPPTELNVGPAEVARRAAELEATLRAALAEAEAKLAARDPGFAERLAAWRAREAA